MYFDDIKEESEDIDVKTELDVEYKIERSSVIPSLRTPVGVKTMDITNHLDYLVVTPYRAMDKVIRASGFKPKNFNWETFWSKISYETNEIKTRIVISRRINPYSVNSDLVGFCSLTELSPNNQLSVIRQNNPDIAKAFCVVINSIIFLSQFLLLKQESTGKRIDIRFYDLKEMMILPNMDMVEKLCSIFDQFAGSIFLSLREQFDTEFDGRYKSFLLRTREKQKTILEFDEIVNPSRERLTFDKDVCEALNLKLSEKEILSIYTVIVNEMIITLRLKKDRQAH